MFPPATLPSEMSHFCLQRLIMRGNKAIKMLKKMKQKRYLLMNNILNSAEKGFSFLRGTKKSCKKNCERYSGPRAKRLRPNIKQRVLLPEKIYKCCKNGAEIIFRILNFIPVKVTDCSSHRDHVQYL